MNTMWDNNARAELLQRLTALAPNSPRQWGKFTCGQMLAHVTDGIRMALGELHVAPKITPFKFWPMKQLIIYKLPFPKGAPTAPELLARRPESIESEKAALASAINRLADRAQQPAWPDHPAFGSLTGQDWGALIYKHLDHHFRQFGV